MGDDPGRRTAARAGEAAQRARELAERRRSMDHSGGSGPDDVQRAQQQPAEAADHAEVALQRAVCGHERAARSHEAAAEAHERAAERGVGDADEHRRRAAEHRRESIANRAAAEADVRRGAATCHDQPAPQAEQGPVASESPDLTPPLGAVRPTAPAAALDTLADLEVAHEELRVAEEQMRVQREQIEALLSRYEAERRWRSHLSGLVPVALAQTDGAGKLLDANPALAALLQVPLPRLAGKPLSVYLQPGDVPAFRSALRSLSTGTADQQRLRVTLHGRHGRAVADLFGFPDAAAGQSADTRLQWVLVPVGPDGDGSPTVDGETRAGPAGTTTLGLAAALAELSALPIGEDDRQRLLSRMAVLVHSAVPGATAVSITVGSPEHPQQLASDSTVAQELDGRQLQAGEGPCWEAHATGEVVLCGDLPRDERWPRLRRVLGPSPVHSVLALPLRETDRTVGVLNVYSVEVDAFRGDDGRIAELVAAAVGGVLQSVAERESLRQLAANLEKALTSRATIDQAKGVLMARLGIDADDAFARLVALSNRLNVKLRDLAQLIVEGHAAEVIAAARL